MSEMHTYNADSHEYWVQQGRPSAFVPTEKKVKNITVYHKNGITEVEHLYRPEIEAAIIQAAKDRKVCRPDWIAPPPPQVKAPPTIVHYQPAANDKVLRKRANNKVISKALSKQLIALGSPMKTYYQRQDRCVEELERKNGTFVSHYCGCKTCQVCNPVRTGKLINKYDELCLSFTDPQFVTLTVKNLVRADYDNDKGFVDALIAQIDSFQKTFRSIQDYFRKRDIPLKGIRALEVIPSRAGDGAHPHIHWQIDGGIDVDEFLYIWCKNKFNRDHAAFLLKQYRKGAINTGALKGELIIQIWLKKMPNTDRQGQNSRPCDANTRKELFKYQTKIFTYDKHGHRKVNIQLVDLIVQSTQHRRTISVTGFLTKLPKMDFEAHLLTKEFKHREKVKEAKALIEVWEKTHNLFNMTCPYTLPEDLDKEAIYQAYMSKYIQQIKDYELYRSLVKALDADINEGLESQQLELSDNLAVDTATGELIQSDPVESETFTWGGDNWYSTGIFIGLNYFETVPRAAIRFKVTNKTKKLIACFNSS